MKTTRLLIALAALLCVGGSAPNLRVSGTARVGTLSRPSGGAAPTYLVEEEFEGTGAPSGWSEFNTVDWDDTATSPGPLVGSQSLRFSSDGAGITPALSSISEVWTYCQFSVDTANDNSGIIYGESSSFGAVFTVATSLSGNLRVVCGSASVDSVATLSNATKYHLWVHYQKGAGANDDTIEAWFSTTSTKPADGSNNHAKSTAGTSDRTVNTIYFGDVHSGDSPGLIDMVRVDDASIGSSPP